MSRHAYLPWLAAMAAAVVTTLIYQQGIAGPWFFDDYPNLQSLLESRTAGWAVMLDEYLMSSSGRFGRPVSMLTFIFSAMTSGENLAGWKWFNLGLHLLTGVSFMWVARRLFEDVGGWESRRAGYAGVLVGTLWLLHPLHVSTVLYTVQRMAILPALFSALGLGLYLSGRRALDQAGCGWLRIAAALFLCWPLATLSKENGALLGIYVLLIEWLSPPIHDKAVAKRIHALLGLLIVLPVLLALAYAAFHPQWLIGGYQLRDFSLTERLLTEARVVWGYLLWVLLPIQRHMGFMHDDVIISTGLMTPMITFWAVAAWALLLPGLWFLRRRLPLIVAGIGLFVASQLMESTVIALELVYEHRTYFGSFGLLLAVVAVLGEGLKQPFSRRLVGMSALILLATLCLLRSQTWSDRNSLYLAMWRAHPESPRLITTFAAQFARNGQFEHALATLERSPDPRTEIASLYVYCLKEGRLSNDRLDGMARPAPARLTDYYLSALVAVAIQGLDKECAYDSRRFAALLDRAMTKTNISGLERYKLLIYKAHHLHAAGDLVPALLSLEEAGKLQPASLIPLSLRTEWLIEAGQLDAARQSFEALKGLLTENPSDFHQRMAGLRAALQAAEEAAAR